MPPFRLVKPVDLKESNKGKKMNVKILTDMKKMMQYVERVGRELNVWEEDPEKWTPAAVTRLYETIHWKFRIKPAGGLRRFEALTWISYLGIIKRAKGKLVGDDDHIQGGKYSGYWDAFINIGIGGGTDLIGKKNEISKK